jgi:ABC-type transporter Mla subunit MlaD
MRHKTKRRNIRKNMTKRGGGLVSRSPPNLASNVAMFSSALAQGLSNITASAIKKGAELLVPNVDVNKPVSQVLQESKDELKKVANVLNSPVGEELVQEASEIGEKVVDAVEKPFEEIGDKGMAYIQKQIPVVEDMAKTTLFGLPVIGSAAAAAEDALDVVQSVENTIATGADMLQSGEQMVTNLQKPLDDASQLYSKYQNALEQPLSQMNNYVDTNVNKLNNTIGPSVNKLNNNMKQLQQAKNMIGGRTRKSQMQFLSPTKFMYGGSKSRRKLRRNKLSYF